MKCKEKTMIYPFDGESVPLIRHNNLVKDHIFSQVISPNGWGFNGKDVAEDEGGEDIGVIIDNNFDKALEQCETVFFTNSTRQIDFHRYIYPKLIKAAEASKNIICSISLESELIEKLHNICNENNKSFKYLTYSHGDIVSPKSNKLYKINTPIIFVAGLGERTQKFEIQLNLRESIEEMGYKVSQVGTRNYCELMGFHSFPGFMYSKAVTETEKVILFNHYIKNIEINEEPDVIIIGIPGGTMPFNYDFTNNFGILAYEISQAIIPDFVVLSTLYEGISTKFLELISNSHKYKFGYNIDCFNISNTSVDFQGSKIEHSLQYRTVDWKFINEKKINYDKLDTPIFNSLDKNDVKAMSQFVIEKLSKYSDTNAV